MADKPIPLDIRLLLVDVDKLEAAFDRLKAAGVPFAEVLERAIEALRTLAGQESVLQKVLGAGARARKESTRAAQEGAKAEEQAAKAGARASNERTRAAQEGAKAEEQAAKAGARAAREQEGAAAGAREAMANLGDELPKTEERWRALTAEQYRALASLKALGASEANLIRLGEQWYEVTDDLVPQFKLLGQTMERGLATSERTALARRRALNELDEEVRALPGVNAAIEKIQAKAEDQLRRETANGGRSLAMLMDEQKGAMRAATAGSELLLENIRDLIAEHVPFGRVLAGVADELDKVVQAEEAAASAGETLQEGLETQGQATVKTGSRYEALSKILQNLKGAKGLAMLAAGGLAAVLTSTASAAVSAAENQAELVKELHDAAAATGLSTEAFSRYRVMFKRLGLDVREGAEIFSELNDRTTEAREGSASYIDTFKRLNISVADLNGPLKSQEALLDTLADRYVEAMSAATSLEKRQGMLKSLQELLGDELYAKLIPAFREGAAGMARFREENDKANLTLSKDGIKAAGDYQAALAQLSLEWDKLSAAVGQTMGQTLLPAMTTATRLVNDLAFGVRDRVRETREEAGSLETQLADLQGRMKALAEQPGVGSDPRAIAQIQEYASLIGTVQGRLDGLKASMARAPGQPAAGQPVTQTLPRAKEEKPPAGAAGTEKRLTQERLQERARALERLQALEEAAARATETELERLMREREEKLQAVQEAAQQAGTKGTETATRARLAIEAEYQKELGALTEKEINLFAERYKAAAQESEQVEAGVEVEVEARQEALKALQEWHEAAAALRTDELAEVTRNEADKLATLQTALEAGLVSVEEAESARTDIQALASAERRRLDEEELATRVSLLQDGSELLKSVTSDVSGWYTEEIEKRLEAANRLSAHAAEAETHLDEEVWKEKAALERKKAAALKQGAMVAHRAAQAAALTTIAVDTFMGAQKALAQNPPPSPVGVASAALVSAAGLVAATKVALEPAPKFRAGGLVSGASHEAGGVLVELEGNEFIMSRRAVEQWGAGALEQMNAGRPLQPIIPMTIALTAKIGERQVAITMAKAMADSPEARAILRTI